MSKLKTSWHSARLGRDVHALLDDANKRAPTWLAAAIGQVWVVDNGGVAAN